MLSAYHEWYNDAMEEYILALAYPEFRPPTRLPGIVPIPTHVYTERLSW